MARIAVLSDVHGNSIAMELFLISIRSIQPDAIICLGDSVGYYPDEEICYQALEDIGAIHLMGNHEAMLSGILPLDLEKDEVYQLNRAASRLPPTRRDSILNFPKQKFIELGTTVAEFYHGSPSDKLSGYVFQDSEVFPIHSDRTSYLFIGNTHRSFCKRKTWGKVINVGSLGMPRDSGNEGTFVVLDTETLTVKREVVQLPVRHIKSRYPNVHPKVLECLNRRSPLGHFDGL